MAPPTMLAKPTSISNGWLGSTKANCAYMAKNRKIISGLLNVTRKAVHVLYQSVPFCCPDWCIFFVGSLW